MNTEELKRLNELLEKVYNTIDEALDRDTFERIEWGVATGLDSLLEAKRSIEEKIERTE